MPVFIGQKFRRGVAGDKSTTKEGYLNVDVTSGGKNKIGPAKVPSNTLSPFKLGPVVDKDGRVALVFENFWQGGKMWPTAGHFEENSETEPSEKWFKFRDKVYGWTKGKRRPLALKDFGTPTGSYYEGVFMGYIESRKRIYVPFYYNLIKNLPVIEELRKLVAKGYKIMIIDGDGAPKHLFPEGLELNEKNWKMMINNPKFPFGHGYVVAAAIAGLSEDIILDTSVEKKRRECIEKEELLPNKKICF